MMDYRPYTDDEVVRLVRGLLTREEPLTDEDILDYAYKVELFIRRVAADERGRQRNDELTQELSKLTSEVERGLSALNVAIMRKR